MSRSAFDRCKEVEQRSLEILKPWLREHTDEGRYVMTDKGRLSAVMQQRFGDILMQKNGLAIWVEVKAEEKYTGNLFVEAWSNLSSGNPGWFHKLNADVILFHFLDRDSLLIVDFQRLREWLLHPYPQREPRFRMLPLKRQRKTKQMNDTWGWELPIYEPRPWPLESSEPVKPNLATSPVPWHRIEMKISVDRSLPAWIHSEDAMWREG